MAYGFVIDLEKCVGCHGCSVACKGANGTPPTVTRSRVDRGTEGSYPNAVRTIRPMLCMMCENPPCVAVCPQGATTIRDEDGIVVIDKEKCIGCKSCMEACPYGARYLVQSEDGYFGSELNEYESVAYENMPKMTVDKCDFCIEHSGDGKPDPVCVKACMAEARLFGDLDEMKKLVAERGGEAYLPEEGTEPRVFYLPTITAYAFRVFLPPSEAAPFGAASGVFRYAAQTVSLCNANGFVMLLKTTIAGSARLCAAFYRPGASACVLPLLPGAGGASCYTVRRTNGGAHGQHTEPRPGYRRAA